MSCWQGIKVLNLSSVKFEGFEEIKQFHWPNQALFRFECLLFDLQWCRRLSHCVALVVGRSISNALSLSWSILSLLPSLKVVNFESSFKLRNNWIQFQLKLNSRCRREIGAMAFIQGDETPKNTSSTLPMLFLHSGFIRKFQLWIPHSFLTHRKG